MSLAVAIAIAALAAGYLSRWRAGGHGVSTRRALAFVGGLAALWVAVGSPLAHLDGAHLTAHMLQHLMIMTVAAPLLWLGDPARVFAPRARRRVAPHPVLCWLIGTGVVIVWHVPAAFAFGMRWHGLQHLTFLVAGLLFWVPVLRPWPTVARWSKWTIPLYLFLATMPCDALSAFLAFSNRVMYGQYACPHDAMAHDVALADQARAGALMWFWVTVAYLVPAAAVTVRLLSPAKRRAIAAFATLALLVGGSRPARAQPLTADDSPRWEYLVDGGALPLFWGALLGTVAMDSWVSPPSTPRLFSAGEGHHTSGSWQVPAWTLQVGGAATALTIVLTGDDSRWDHAKGLLEALATSGLITTTLKVTFGRHRPDWTADNDSASERKSFPSGHSTAAFAIATYSVLYLDAHVFDEMHASPLAVGVTKAFTYAAIGAGASLVALERTANHHHFVTDVVAGGVIGAATSTLIYLYQERRYRGRERADRAPLVAPSVTGDGVGLAISGMF